MAVPRKGHSVRPWAVVLSVALTRAEPAHGLLNHAMSHRDRFLAYLSAYQAKDIVAVGQMFSDDVRLRDWNICVEGKAAALAETRKNFDAVQTLEIVPLKLYETQDAVAGELQIVVNGEIDLRVIDAIEFDPHGRIVSIHAYKGRPEGG